MPFRPEPPPVPQGSGRDWKYYLGHGLAAVGPIAGAAIGSYASNPQLGAAIGGSVGNAANAMLNPETAGQSSAIAQSYGLAAVQPLADIAERRKQAARENRRFGQAIGQPSATPPPTYQGLTYGVGQQPPIAQELTYGVGQQLPNMQLSQQASVLANPYMNPYMPR